MKRLRPSLLLLASSHRLPATKGTELVSREGTRPQPTLTARQHFEERTGREPRGRDTWAEKAKDLVPLRHPKGQAAENWGPAPPQHGVQGNVQAGRRVASLRRMSERVLLGDDAGPQSVTQEQPGTSSQAEDELTGYRGTPQPLPLGPGVAVCTGTMVGPAHRDMGSHPSI